MSRQIRLPTLLLLFLSALSTASGRFTDEVSLFEWISSDYNVNVRPKTDSSNPLLVDAQVRIQMIDTDVGQGGVLLVDLAITLEWDDETLANAPVTLQQPLVVPADQIWTPDVAIKNSAGSVRSADWVGSHPLVVDMSGATPRVTWTISDTFPVRCRLLMYQFPRDAHICTVDLGSQSLISSRLAFSNAACGINQAFIDNSAFLVEETRECDYNNSGTHAQVTYELQLTRRSYFYLANIELPCYILAVLATIGFGLPMDSGDRIGLLITVLLAFTVFLLIITDTIPFTTNVPFLTYFVLSMIIVVAVGLAVMVCVERFHKGEGPSPRMTEEKRKLWAKRLNTCGCVLGTITIFVILVLYYIMASITLLFG